MAEAARERLARLLGGDEVPKSFSAQVLAPPDTLCLEVDGVGPIRLPVQPAQARKLCEAAERAKFGHQEETILDPAVRDTWEAPRQLVHLEDSLGGALTELADELAVPKGCRLELELHALLVYMPGQFFLPHQAERGLRWDKLNRLLADPQLVERRGNHPADQGFRGMRHHSDLGDEAVPIGVHRLHGELGRHAGSLVPPGGHRVVAEGTFLRGPGRGVRVVGAA
jgi:hypothetical protein